MITLDDYEAAARERLSHMAYEFLVAGAADETTLRWNREAFAHIRLAPRVLEDVTTIDTRVSLFGETHDLPILLAPVAYQRLFHDEGEVASARGAREAGVTFVVSTASNSTIEDIATTGARLWLQIYIQEDLDSTRDFVARAEAAGVRAVCLTVDTPVVGTRTRQQRANFALPADLPTPHLDAEGRRRLGTTSMKRKAVTWRDVEWLQSITTLPILLKGILTPDDARSAVEHGASGIVVSNHGARNLDTVPATIDALPRVAEQVDARIPILMDGGIRRGTDVVKALARGASAVLIGRPYAYALAVEGAEGVKRVIDILREELETALALMGIARVRDVGRGALWDG